jgi:hypothetical protein
MPDGSGIWIVVYIIAIAVSVVIAYVASGQRASPWWGLLGPPGWVIAAVRGTHFRLEDLVNIAVSQERAIAMATKAAAQGTDDAPVVDRIVGAADPDGRALVECGACHERQRLFPETGLTARCTRCHRTIPDFSRRRGE